MPLQILTTLPILKKSFATRMETEIIVVFSRILVILPGLYQYLNFTNFISIINSELQL
jgi:hypothetical protein